MIAESICWPRSFPINHWHRFIGDATSAYAISDRLHHSERIELTGMSLRKRQGGGVFPLA